MALVDRLQAVNSRLLAIPDRLGVPFRKTVVIKVGTVYTQILPRPSVEPVDGSQNFSFLSDAVEINIDDIWIKDVPRSFSLDLVSNGQYLLEATQNLDLTWSGQKAEALYVDKSDMLVWNILVRKQRAR